MTEPWRDEDETLQTLVKSGAGMLTTLLLVVAGFQAWGGASGGNDHGATRGLILLVGALALAAIGWWSVPRMLAHPTPARSPHSWTTVALVLVVLASVVLAWQAGRVA